MVRGGLGPSARPSAPASPRWRTFRVDLGVVPVADAQAGGHDRRAMDPTTLYFALVAFGVFIGLAALIAGKGPTRECPQCGGRVVTTARRCRACHFQFT